jgi:hypothetical protein
MYGHHGQVQHQQGVQGQVSQSSPSFQLPSPAHSPASLGMPISHQVDEQAGYQSHYHPQQQHQQQQGYYSSSSESPVMSNGSIVYDSQPSQVAYQHQQPLQYAPPQVPVVAPQNGAPVAQLVTINGVTYAVAMPVQAPAPAAIETPHGTYYFVPSAPQQQQQQQVQQEQFVLSSGLPAPVANSIPGLDMGGGLPSFGASIAQPQPHSYQSAALAQSIGQAVSSAVPHVSPTPLDPQQKIRLPVGQGKRGSTKRAPKKDQVKRFVCPFDGCGRGFARNFNMQSHYKSHLGVRECAFPFLLYALLANSTLLRRTDFRSSSFFSSLLSTPVPPLPPFHPSAILSLLPTTVNCPHCTKKFSRRHDRARHCAAVHDSQVDRDGNVLGASNGSIANSAMNSPSSAHSHEHDRDEHDELHEDVGLEPFNFEY